MKIIASFYAKKVCGTAQNWSNYLNMLAKKKYISIMVLLRSYTRTYYDVFHWRTIYRKINKYTFRTLRKNESKLLVSLSEFPVF